MSEKTEKWEEHNETFRYDPPDDPPELWSSEEFTELYDRVIRRSVTWTCQECERPFNRLEKARRHVESQHSERLLDQYAERESR